MGYNFYISHTCKYSTIIR